MRRERREKDAERGLCGLGLDGVARAGELEALDMHTPRRGQRDVHAAHRLGGGRARGPRDAGDCDTMRGVHHAQDAQRHGVRGFRGDRATRVQRLLRDAKERALDRVGVRHHAAKENLGGAVHAAYLRGDTTARAGLRDRQRGIARQRGVDDSLGKCLLHGVPLMTCPKVF